MDRIKRPICWSVSLTILFLASPAQGAIIEFLTNPDLSIVDLRESFVEYVECQASDSPLQSCIKILWDPPGYLQEGVMTVDIAPVDGDISRVGNVQSITFFNGYTGSGPFDRTDGPDFVRFEIPVVSVERPPENLTNVDIVELLVSDTGIGENRLSFNFSAEDVLVVPEDGGPAGPAEVIEKTEFLGYNVPLTTAQAVPPPTIPDGTVDLPMGSAVVNVDPDSGEIRVNGEYWDMTSEVTVAHLHGPAPAGQVAPPIFTLDTSGGTEGTFAGESVLSSESLGEFFAGLTYVNVHTELNPASEIRGQLVPEPSAMALLTLGFIFVAVRRRPSPNYS